MKLFVLGLRRSGTTILYDALRADAGLRCFYEPLREQDVTEGGGSGARAGDAFAETRTLREAYRDEHYPKVPIQEFNWGGPRAPGLELDPGLPPHCLGFLEHLLGVGEDVAIKETRLHHKLGALATIAPEATVVHLVRDPRAVSSSMLLGRKRRLDVYPDADAFFTARTKRKLWSSRAISEQLIAGMSAPGLPADPADFLRPLLVWKAAFEALHSAGERLFGTRYLLVRLEDLRRRPADELARIYAAAGSKPPDQVAVWAVENLRPGEDTIQHPEDPRWAEAFDSIGLTDTLHEAGYDELRHRLSGR